MITENKHGMVITVTNSKGGVGKTDSNFNLGYAAAINEPDKSVLFVNADNQKTLEHRFGRRKSNGFKDLDNVTFDNCTAAALKHTIPRYKELYDYIFIDVAANSDDSALTSFVFCDLIYFVLNPSKSCTEVIPSIIKGMTKAIRVRSSACVYKSFYSKVSPLPHVASAQIADSNRELAKYASIITPCDFSLAYRGVYEKCSITGECITERKVLKSDISGNKAKAEIAAFYEDFKNTVELIKSVGDSK
jgi:cellulose biosynthesis protein BcsQ